MMLATTAPCADRFYNFDGFCRDPQTPVSDGPRCAGRSPFRTATSPKHAATCDANIERLPSACEVKPRIAVALRLCRAAQILPSTGVFRFVRRDAPDGRRGFVIHIAFPQCGMFLTNLGGNHGHLTDMWFLEANTEKAVRAVTARHPGIVSADSFRCPTTDARRCN
jgi:hypothetical protein